MVGPIDKQKCTLEATDGLSAHSIDSKVRVVGTLLKVDMSLNGSVPV